jgi:tRNA A37 methylthiotransferase MiaB
MQIKGKGLVDKVFVTGCLSERYRPDLKKSNVDQYFGTTELPALLKALGADYKHELLGERLTTTPKLRLSKLPKVATDLVVFVLSNHARKTRIANY